MTVAEVGELIRGLVIPGTPAGLRDAVAARDLLDARIAVAVGEFDFDLLGDADCGLSTTNWLQHRTRVDPKGAGRLTALGRRLHRFPLLRDAALAGSITGGQLQIVSACVPEKHLARFAEHEAALVPLLEGLGIPGTTILLQDWRAKADAAADDGPDGSERNELFHSKTLDARSELRGSFDADRTATLDAALREAEPDDPSKSKPERRADALDAMARFFLDHHTTDPKQRNRPHVNVVMTLDEFVAGLGGTYVGTGQPVGATTAEVLRCDSDLHRVLVDSEGAILDYGRATRAWLPDIAAAIQLRDQGCRWEGCTAPADRCQIHHVKWWVRDHGDTTSPHLWDDPSPPRRRPGDS